LPAAKRKKITGRFWRGKTWKSATAIARDPPFRGEQLSVIKKKAWSSGGGDSGERGIFRRPDHQLRKVELRLKGEVERTEALLSLAGA